MPQIPFHNNDGRQYQNSLYSYYRWTAFLVDYISNLYRRNLSTSTVKIMSSSPPPESEQPRKRPMPLTQEQLHPVYLLEEYLHRFAPENDEPVDLQHCDAKHDQILGVADFLFGTTLLSAALTLLDSHESTFTQISTHHRSIWLVRGSGEGSYLCFACEKTPNLYYCNCRSFLEKTTKKANDLPEFCKHLLALKLVPALGMTCPQLTVSEGEFAKLVLERTMSRTC